VGKEEEEEENTKKQRRRSWIIVLPISPPLSSPLSCDHLFTTYPLSILYKFVLYVRRKEQWKM